MSVPDAEIQGLIDLLEIGEVPAPTLTPSEIRDAFEAFAADMSSRGSLAQVERVDDAAVKTDAGPVATRTYEPTGNPAERLDVIVFFHGGGWVAGDLVTGDPGARALAAGLGLRVVSVDYRLAPEAPFPAAFEDCFAVVREIVGRAETASVVVAGESAGGNLAAAVAIACRDKGISLAGQILLNPVLDLVAATESRRRLAEGYGLTTADVDRYADWYAKGADRNDPRLSPGRAPSLHGIAPSIVVTAGFDPLHDEARDFAVRLVKESVPVTYLPMPTLLHGWWSLLPASAVARGQLERLLDAVRSLVPEQATRGTA
jgi:acetyl esterase